MLPDGYRARLLGAQQLTEAEVQELRAGRMTPAAEHAVRAGIGRQRVFMTVGAAVAVLGVVASFLLASLDPAHARWLGPIPLSAGLVPFVAGLGLLLAGLLGASTLRADQKDGVFSLEGPLDAWIPGLDRSTPKRQLQIAGVVFSSNNDPLVLVVFDCLADKRPHRVFVTKRRRLIVGVEPMP